MAWNRIKSNVLVPIESEENAAAALEVARAFVESPGQIHILTVVVPPSPTSPGALWGTVDTNTVLAGTEEFMHKVAVDNGVGDARVHVRMGSAVREIARFAHEEQIELIVLPSRGRTGLDRVLLGSTAEGVVRRAKCEVYVIHPQPLE